MTSDDPAGANLAGLEAAGRVIIDPDSLTMFWDRQTMAALACSEFARMWDVDGLADSLDELEKGKRSCRD